MNRTLFMKTTVYKIWCQVLGCNPEKDDIFSCSHGAYNLVGNVDLRNSSWK